MKYRVKGIYQMVFFVDIDDDVEADSEEEAIMTVQDRVSAGQAYDQEHTWYDAGPEVWLIEDGDDE